ncbi:YheC/YheD family endospore coat-associated protein [Paenibacillus sp. KN14-4R]|uniref:YheC/YheD family endospore coat-associated protein n=1 Tax=Paenibacillus sp. KN14-4R TaxID=3445773 RepID=UPI003F9F3384
MSLTTCTIHTTLKPSKMVYVSNDLARTLHLTNSKNILVRFGSKSFTAPLRVVKKAGLHLYLSILMFNTIKIPRTGNCYVVSTNGKEISLGPLIGIFTSHSGNSLSPFGGRTAFIRQIMRTGNDKSFFVAFGPNDVDWQNETINGYIMRPNGAFVRRTVPLPDVVYNRLSSRKIEKQPSMEGFKERFERRDIPLFNWSFFDKSDVYALLEKDEQFKHVPESVINPSPSKLKEMLQIHRFIYLKPSAGSLGIGIYRVTYHPHRGYFVRYRKNNKNILLRFAKFDDLVRMLGINRGMLGQYVAQQGIRLIEIDNCPIDFRFHMTKNMDDEWVVAAIGAKKAGKGSVTTHIRTGGSLMTPQQVLEQVYGNHAESVLSNAKSTAIRLAEALEQNYQHRLGELGFDLGIDQREQIWMFEANSKPGRSIFKHPSLKAEERASLTNIYEHCLFLSKFRVRRNE